MSPTPPGAPGEGPDYHLGLISARIQGEINFNSDFDRNVVALWEAFYIENKLFDRDTLRVPNRSPTPISKSKDLLGQSDDIWGGARAFISGRIGGFPGSGPA